MRATKGAGDGSVRHRRPRACSLMSTWSPPGGPLKEDVAGSAIPLEQIDHVPQHAHLFRTKSAECLVPDDIPLRGAVKYRVGSAVWQERTVRAHWHALENCF